MPTALVSDFHLGSPASALATPPVLGRLLTEVAEADQLVLLGDVLSLRASSLGDVLATARPVFEALGDAMAGRRVVLVPGNHDHRLAAPLLERLSREHQPLPLEAVEPVAADARGIAGRLAGWLDRAELLLAYPGVWVRPDVYATHGHYLDCHMTVPRVESLLAAGMQAVRGRIPTVDATPEHYESVLAPFYAFAQEWAQAPGPQDGAPGRTAYWRDLLVDGGRSRRAARGAARLAVAAGVAGLNRAGLGPFRRALSPADIARAGLDAMGAVVGRLRIDAEHVVFGHTHRLGPLPGESRFEAPGGARLVNAGSWTYQPVLVDERDPRDPYWPGGCVWVDDTGAPEPRALLREATALPAAG